MSNDIVVEKSRLIILRDLVSRGQTLTVQVVEFQGERFVFKAYDPEVQALVLPENLTAHVEWRNGLEAEAREILDRFASWPLRVVVSDGKLVGCLVAVAPSSFWDGGQQLGSPRSAVSKIDSTRKLLGTKGRFRCAGELLKAVATLHSLGIVIGDLQVANILVGDREGVYFIDMDSALVEGRSCFREKFEPVHMASPIEGEVHSISSDWYKCARVILAIVYQDLSVAYYDDNDSFFSELDRKLLSYMLEGDFEDPQGLMISVGNRWILEGSRDFFGARPPSVPSASPGDSVKVMNKAKSEVLEGCLMDLFTTAFWAYLVLLFVSFLLSFIPGPVGDFAKGVYQWLTGWL